MSGRALEFRHDWLIGVDDTDNAESIGTGRLCRLLAAELRTAGYDVVGVTRHQHLKDPAIPYTSNNSSCALGVNGKTVVIDDLHRFCVEFLERHFHPGADPGLCVVTADALHAASDLTTAFGRATQERVVSLAETQDLANRLPARLTMHGGTGLGIIGALGAACLRGSGHDGRFLELGGLRDAPAEASVAELEVLVPIEGVFSLDGVRLPADARVVTGEWVRPTLENFRARLYASRGDSGLWNLGRSHHEK